MDKQTRLELAGHTARLDTYEAEEAIMERLRPKLLALYAQTHETIQVGPIRRRVVLTKRRKIAKANRMIDAAFKGVPDISQDAIDQLRIFADE